MFQYSGGVSVSRSLSISDNTQNTQDSTQVRKMKILQAVLAVFVFLAISSTMARSLAGTEGDIFDTHTGENVLHDSQDVPRATPWPQMVKAWFEMKMID